MFTFSPSEGPCCSGNCTYYSKSNVTCRPATECSMEATCQWNDAKCPESRLKPDKTICRGQTQYCSNGVRYAYLYYTWRFMFHFSYEKHLSSFPQGFNNDFEGSYIISQTAYLCFYYAGSAYLKQL